MSQQGVLRTRRQRLVDCLERALPVERSELEQLRPRALDLPAMLRRHGPMQVLLFLCGKREEDGRLAEVLLQGIHAGLGEKAPGQGAKEYAVKLASLELPQYLLHAEAAIETASWLKLLVEARLKGSGGPAGLGGGG